MSSSLLDSLSGLITPEVIGKAASFFGESNTAASKGIAAVLPLVLGGVASKAGDQGFASSLFDVVSNPANDGAVLGNIGSLLGPGAASSSLGGLGSRLLAAVFGDNVGAVGAALSNYAGVKGSTGTSLLSVAAPLVLSVLGKATKSGGLNASSLASLLLGQRSAIASAIPGPLADLDRMFTGSSRPSAAVTQVPERGSPSVLRWLIPLLIALVAIWLLSSLFGRRQEPTETAPPPVATQPAPAPEPTPAPGAGPSTETGATTPSANLSFEVGSADLPADSTGGLEPVVAYLKANPSTKAVVSGFHDSTGDAAKNEELAKNRAAAVRNALEGAGIDEERIDLEKPVVTTGGGTPEDARRVEVTVR